MISRISFNYGYCYKIFLLKQKNQNYFCTGFPKSALKGGKSKFCDFFIATKKLGKLKKIQTWVVFFEYREKTP